jgi:hypothetical protein
MLDEGRSPRGLPRRLRAGLDGLSRGDALPPVHPTPRTPPSPSAGQTPQPGRIEVTGVLAVTG